MNRCGWGTSRNKKKLIKLSHTWTLTHIYTHIHTHASPNKQISKKMLGVKSRMTRKTERQGTTREGPAEGYKGDKVNGALLKSNAVLL